MSYRYGKGGLAFTTRVYTMALGPEEKDAPKPGNPNPGSDQDKPLFYS